jgi:hypothetical protein
MPATPTSNDCLPRYATQRNESRPNLLEECERIAAQLGIKLMEWQRLVLAVATELLPDGTFAYREVIITVPRQNGKTLLLMVKKIHRAVMWAARVQRPQRMVYTAQTGRDAVKKVLEDEVPILMASPFAAVVDSVRKVNGSEGIAFKGGSRIDILASSESAGHGRTVDEGYVDEAFDDVDDRREQAILPALSTRRDGQLWVVSTMGTDASLYLNRKVETGRAAVLRPDSEIAYFEWSAPADADIHDVATWYGCMPALISPLSDLDERAVRHASETMPEGEFRRAFLNQQTSSTDRVIPEDVWRRVCGPDVQPDGKLTMGIDVNPERSMAAICCSDGSGNVELLDHDRGTGWLVTRTQQLCSKWNASVAVDPAGPAGAFIPELKAARVKVVEVGGSDFTKACGLFFDAVADQKVRVRTDPRLDAAVAAAQKRTSADAWVWGRKLSADVSPLVAATVAYWASTTQGNKVPHFYA